MKYRCRNCNYGFDSASADECRFCGMEEIEPEKNARELLDEVEGLFR